MKSQVPDVYPLGYYTSEDYYLWLTVIIIGFIGSYILFTRYKKLDKNQGSLYLGLSFFSIGSTLARIAYLLSIRVYSNNYDFVTSLGYNFLVIGMLLFLFIFEKNVVRKTHFFFSIITAMSIILGVLSMFSVIPRDYPRIIMTLIGFFNIILILSIYFSVARRSAGIIRKKTWISFFGIILIFLGIIIDSELMYGVYPMMWVGIPPLLTIIGYITVITFQRVD